MNGIISLFFFSMCLSFVYMKVTDFWVLVLYLATLLNVFIRFSRFLVESLGSSMYPVYTAAVEGHLTSSFPLFVSSPSISLKLDFMKTE